MFVAEAQQGWGWAWAFEISSDIQDIWPQPRTRRLARAFFFEHTSVSGILKTVEKWNGKKQQLVQKKAE